MHNKPYLSYNTIVLERIKFGASTYLSKALIEDISPRNWDVSIEEQPHARYMLDALVMTVRSEILGEHLERKTVKYPANWKQACKEAFYNWCGGGWDGNGHWPWLGDYARAKCPVRYHISDIDVKALYPKMAIPKEGKIHISRLDHTGWGNADTWQTE